MKVLQISTSSTGGAGVAANHLFDLLCSAGIETKLITRDSLSASHGSRFNLNTLAGKFFTVYQKSMLHDGYDLATPISIGQGLMREVSDFEPDVVHIHNWYNLMSLDQIAALGRKYPIIFTLHDERLLTGGCHITLGCNHFLSGCIGCPAVVHSKKLISQSYKKSHQIFQEIGRLGIVAPSTWLIERAKSSPILRHVVKFECIPNVTTLQDTNSLKQRADSLEGPLRLVFVAADLSAKVKNLSSAIDAVDLYSRISKIKSKITLTVVGQNFPRQILKNPNFEMIHQQFMDQPSLMKLFRESDVLLISSQSENSPNIVSEAQLSGLIVVASAVGGIPELIQDGKTGFLADATPAGIAAALLRYESCESKEEIRLMAIEVARRRCDRALILLRHLDVYESVLRV
jgi:glycosyltransferase involved in cell wall biosynthesis